MSLKGINRASKAAHSGQTESPPQRVAKLAILFALLLLFSLLESIFPPPPLPLPVRWGLANLVVMYAVFVLPLRFGLSLVILKAAFAFVSRGLIAGGLSICGGFLAWLIVVLLFETKPGYWSIPFVSILGALGHQLGQLLALSIFYPSFGLQNFARLSLPLVIIAYLTGALNGFLLCQLMVIEKL